MQRDWAAEGAERGHQIAIDHGGDFGMAVEFADFLSESDTRAGSGDRDVVVSVFLPPRKFADGRWCRVDDIHNVVSRQPSRLHRLLAGDELDVPRRSLGDFPGVVGIRTDEFDAGCVGNDCDGSYLDGFVVEDTLGVSDRRGFNASVPSAT